MRIPRSRDSALGMMSERCTTYSLPPREAAPRSIWERADACCGVGIADGGSDPIRFRKKPRVTGVLSWRM